MSGVDLFVGDVGGADPDRFPDALDGCDHHIHGGPDADAEADAVKTSSTHSKDLRGGSCDAWAKSVKCRTRRTHARM